MLRIRRFGLVGVLVVVVTVVLGGTAFAAAGVISAIAGPGTGGFSGDGAAATSAQLNAPYGVAVDGVGNVFIADANNHRVRRIDAVTGFIGTIAGTGINGFSGDGGAATSAQLNSPLGVAVDGVGNVFIADSSNHRVRRVDAVTGFISTFAGTGTFGFSGDSAAATSAQLYYPWGGAVDGGGNVFIGDSFNHRVRRVDAGTGFISTLAGTGTAGFSGDGAAASSAQLYNPRGVAADGDGNVYIGDTNNHRIRKIDADLYAETVGLVDPSAGLWYLRSDAGAVASFYFGNPGDYPIVGDWDCDGDDTPGMYRHSD